MKRAFSFALFCSVALISVIASADPIAILNQSFENPSFTGPGNNWTDQNIDWGDDAGTSPDEFTELTTDAFTAGVTGTFHLFNHVGIQGAGFLQQDLTTNFAPNTTYTLTVAGGNRAAQGLNTSAALFEIRDSADNVLAPGSADLQTLAPDSFADFSVQFTTGAVAPSGAIRLWLSRSQDPNTGGRAHFDNIRLDGSAIPEPTTFALLGLGGLGMLARRRRA